MIGSHGRDMGGTISTSLKSPKPRRMLPMWRTKTDIRIQKPRPHCHTNWIWFLWTLSLSLSRFSVLAFFLLLLFPVRWSECPGQLTSDPVKSMSFLSGLQDPQEITQVSNSESLDLPFNLSPLLLGFPVLAFRSPAIMPWHSAISLQIPQPSRGQNGQTRPCYVRAWIQRLRTCEESPCTAEIPIFHQIDLARVSKTLMLGIQKNLSRKYLEKGN